MSERHINKRFRQKEKEKIKKELYENNKSKYI